MTPDWQLNARASRFVDDLIRDAAALRIELHDIPGGGRVVDFGVKSEGSLAAGLALARVCTAGLADITLVPGDLGDAADRESTSLVRESPSSILHSRSPPLAWPHVQVVTDAPMAASLYSQYAGWQISVGKFFAMGSGPMRAVSARETVFEQHGYRESPDRIVGVLEGRRLPTAEVFEFIAAKTGVPADRTTLLIAPTASVTGNLQVVARVVETCLHKLFELGFDVRRVSSAWGVAPLSPVAQDDLTGIGRTNDAILYGGRVTLWVHGDDDSIADVGPRVPACSTACYGRPFLEIFEAAGRDFYKIDPHLFSPAEVVFQNLDTGRVQKFGGVAMDIVRKSFGL
jgi:methenyltetrahydromethanopterin cyclohydrolase